jgi:hypothetical protein
LLLQCSTTATPIGEHPPIGRRKLDVRRSGADVTLGLGFRV